MVKKIIILINLFLVGGCGTYATLRSVSPDEIHGRFDLIIYGGRYLDDIETVAILDNHDDRYIFRVFAPLYDFKVEKGMDKESAIKRAEGFLRSQRGVFNIKVSSISVNGTIAGYELIPLYDPFMYGTQDVLDTEYLIRDDEILVRIRLKPLVERMLSDGNGIKDPQER